VVHEVLIRRRGESQSNGHDEPFERTTLGFKRGCEIVGGVHAELVIIECKVEGIIHKGTREHVEKHIGVLNRIFDFKSAYV
jgi:hypothetical protein